MRTSWILLLVLSVLHVPLPARSLECSGTLLFGYDGGPAGSAETAVNGFLPDSPLSARLGLGRTSRPAGNALEARRIFINNATNGTPEKGGWTWIARLDLVHPIGHLGGGALSVFAGPRYSSYTARFRYVGGNEEFDVTSGQWGWGGGVETALPMGGRTQLMFRGGFDYFLEAPLHGHDTRYDPDGEDVNPREDYRYSDADGAIEQPGLVGRALAGIRIRLGR